MENAWSTSFSVDAGASSNAAGGSLSAGGPLSGSEKTPSITRFDPAFTAPSNRPKITLSEPTKHGEGTQAFVSYLVTSDKQVRRRFQDFIQLHRWLMESYPACIIPTLPGKAHSKYVIGDRFSKEFLDRRMVALQSFVDRVNRHPILANSECFAKFLSADQMALVDTSTNATRDSTLFDNITDNFLHAFSKPKVPDEQFQRFRDTIEKLETNIMGIEKLHWKIVRAEKELVTSFSEIGGAVESLASMETQVKDPLTKFGVDSQTHVSLLKEKISNQDLDYISPLHNYVTYCGAVKELLRLRDQKQVDHEELQRFLNEAVADRDRTRATGKSPGIGGFFKDKINDFKGVDPEKTRRERLEKVECKIEELTREVDLSLETSQKFSAQVKQELDFFASEKKSDFRELFRAYTDAQLAFHERGLAFWNDMIPVVNDIELQASPTAKSETL